MPCKTCISLRLLNQSPIAVARFQQIISILLLMPTPATPLSITSLLLSTPLQHTLPTPLQYTPVASPKHLLQHIFKVHPDILVQTSATEVAVAMLVVIVFRQM